MKCQQTHPIANILVLLTLIKSNPILVEQVLNEKGFFLVNLFFA